MAVVGLDLVRSAEWRRVREFAETVRTAPAALAVQGEAGAGKSTLWGAGIQTALAAGQRLLRSEPSASETDLSFAGLSVLLADVLPLVADQIPGPQREALEVALLLRPAGGEPPAARAIGLAVLAALRGCVSEGPILVAIDDVQWLDQASLEALTFALRRVPGGPLSLLVAARSEAAADPLTSRRAAAFARLARPARRAARCRGDRPRAAGYVADPEPAAQDGHRRPGPGGGPAVPRQPVLGPPGLGQPGGRRESGTSAGTHAHRPPVPYAERRRHRRPGGGRGGRPDRGLRGPGGAQGPRRSRGGPGRGGPGQAWWSRPGTGWPPPTR